MKIGILIMFILLNTVFAYSENRYFYPELKIKDFDVFIDEFKNALDKKDEKKILKLSSYKIIYDVEDRKMLIGRRYVFQSLIKSKFNYELVRKYLYYSYKISADKNKSVITFHMGKNIYDSKYIVRFENINQQGWVFDGILPPMDYSIVFFSIKKDDIKLMEMPSLKSKVIKKLKKGDVVGLIEDGKNDVVDGILGNWIFVRTEDGEDGFCFSEYLDEIENNKEYEGFCNTLALAR